MSKELQRFVAGLVSNEKNHFSKWCQVCHDIHVKWLKLGRLHHMMFWLFNRQIPIQRINKKTGKKWKEVHIRHLLDHFVLYGQSLQLTGSANLKSGCYEDRDSKTSLCILCTFRLRFNTKALRKKKTFKMMSLFFRNMKGVNMQSQDSFAYYSQLIWYLPF